MYSSFFGLKQTPFDLTPDPAYFISTTGHDEALATLYYGVRQHKGFIVVTGEVGTGKTLLLRYLLQLLQESPDVAYSYLFNTHLNDFDFLQYLISDFGIPTAGKSKSDLLLALTAFLTHRGARDLTTVLVIDEAHDLSEDLLEEIRLLSNIETARDKLLQILLIGQPELEAKLDSVGLRQLKQRIALRARLGELSPAETEHYISQRLEIAGADPQRDPIFSADAVAAIYHYSHGIPRLINTICENALISAFANQISTVTPGIIDAVAREFRLDNKPAREFESVEAKSPKTAHAPLEITNLFRNAR